LRHLGLLIAKKPYAHQPEVLSVTREGARIADVGIYPATLVLAELQHTLAVVALGEYLAARHPGAVLTTERELWADRYRRLYSGADSSHLGRVPDAILRIPAAGTQGVMTVALELDLSRKDRRAMETMIARYDHVAVDVVWWYVKPARLDRVRALVAELGAEDRFKVLPWVG
jgi:hypothetical protein